jgi:hypothetical protein
MKASLTAVLVTLGLIVTVRAAGPAHVDLTWMSISNVYYELGDLRILTDGYITRLPQGAFFGGGGGLASTRQTFKPDVDAVRRVLEAIGGPSSVNLLLTGHRPLRSLIRYGDVVAIDRGKNSRVENDVLTGRSTGHSGRPLHGCLWWRAPYACRRCRITGDSLEP